MLTGEARSKAARADWSVMAYTDEEYLVTVNGRIADGEIWANVWCILRTDDTKAVQVGVNQIRGFYNDLIASLSNDWHADSAHVRNLGTGVSFAASWETFAGEAGADNLPTECALRLSLSDLAGHNGGPYLSGFTVANLEGAGKAAIGTQTAIVGAVDALASGLLANGFQLRLNRPSVSQTVAPLQAKVGRTYDVIRKRRNQSDESYSTVSLV